MLNEIIWPEAYLPGTTDNFASNEIIVAGLTAQEVFSHLTQTAHWSGYYDNVADVKFYNQTSTVLQADSRFSFKTFGFPVEAQVTEFVPPTAGAPGRLAWHGWVEGDAEHRLDVIHAWLIEELPQARVRILTQESQKGAPARALFETKPDVMNAGHQDWIKGLAKAVLQEKRA